MVAKNKKRQASSDSRKRILQAAVMLFAKKGYGSCGLRELAAAANVNLAMINYFFGSKKELLKEILDVFFSGYLAVARRELKGNEEESVKLNRFIHGSIEFFYQHREYLLVTITELPHDDPEIVEYKANWAKQMVELVKEHLKIGKPNARGNILPPVIFCSMLTSMMASRFLFTPVMERVQHRELGVTSMEEYADIISKIFIKGF